MSYASEQKKVARGQTLRGRPSHVRKFLTKQGDLFPAELALAAYLPGQALVRRPARSDGEDGAGASAPASW